MNKETFANNWENVVAEKRNELVFENKNKLYGAYYLRVNHNKNLGLGLLIASSFFIILVGTPLIVNLINSSSDDANEILTVTTVDLMAPPPIDEKEPEPAPPPPPPPLIKTIKFTPPVVKDEEILEEEEEIPIQEDEDLTQIAAVTNDVEGDDDDFSLLDEYGDGVVEQEDNTIHMFVGEMPKFPGGDEALLSYIQRNTEYPAIAYDSGIEGTCYLYFVVEKDGTIGEVTVVKGVPGCKKCDENSVRVIKSLPKFTPGKNNGTPVRVRYSSRVKFELR